MHLFFTLLLPLAMAQPVPGTPCGCNTPTRPACVDNMATYGDEQAFYNCRWDVQSYFEQNDEYSQCLQHCADYMNKLADAAILEGTQTTSLFNCRASGSGKCATEKAIATPLPSGAYGEVDLRTSPFYSTPTGR